MPPMPAGTTPLPVAQVAFLKPTRALAGKDGDGSGETAVSESERAAARKPPARPGNER
jgi:hypothetical protein